MTMLSCQSIARLADEFSMLRRKDGKPLRIEPVSLDIHLDEFLLGGETCRQGVLKPGVFCLGSTIETFAMPNYVVGFVVGKSTLAREGLQIEAAGLIDPGFWGDITLELKNLHHEDEIILKSGSPIGQVYFMHIDEPVDYSYGPDNGNHYQGQLGVTRSYRKLLP
jgi:deoxycytidine triphosphate deaminase